MIIQRMEERCSPCLLCVRECVAGAWREMDGRPAMVAPELCNRCGHCVAVCPRGAIVHKALDPVQIRKARRALLKPEIYEEIVRGRRSIRQYRDTPVPARRIQEILELASHSPTASNRQQVGYTVITDKTLLSEISGSVFNIGRRIHAGTRRGAGKWIYDRINKIAPGNSLERYLDPMPYYISQWDKGRDYVLHRAPVLILVHGPRRGPFHAENANIATANIMNHAHAAGLGTCYIGFLSLALKFSRRLRSKVQLPHGRKAYACLVMGYPAYRHLHTTSRKKPAIRWIR